MLFPRKLGYSFACLCLVLSSLAILSVKAEDGPQTDLIFFQDFENGFDAAWSNGSGRALCSHNLSLVEGHNLKGVWVQPKNFLRYDAAGNIDMDSCTIAVWTCLNWDPPVRRPLYGGEYQTIWSVNTRDDNSIGLGLRIVGERTYLEFLASRTNWWALGIFLDITPRFGEGWRSGEWHEVACSWKKPDMLRMVVDGRVISEKRVSSIPNLSSEDMLNLYIGVNRESALGRMDHFDGVIDEIRIYSDFDATVGDVDPGNLPKREEMAGLVIPQGYSDTPYRSDHNASIRWVSNCRYRINLAAASQTGPWNGSPAWVHLDFPEILDGLNASGRVSLDSIRVVEFDPESGEPLIYDTSRPDESRYFLPYVLDASFDWSDVGRISWVKEGSGASGYTIYFDTRPVYDRPFPQEYPLVGNGDRLRIGRKGGTGRLSVGIWGEFDVADLDKDGDPDLLINSGIMTPPCTDLQLGLYYFENLGKAGENGDYVFAPGRLVKNGYGNSGYGLISGNSGFNLVDIDRDGSLDILYVGKYAAEWGRIGWEGNRPVITDWHLVDFGEKFDAGRSPGSCVAWNLPRSTYVDWDGDGLRELIAGNYVYRNYGTDTSPRFYTNCRYPLTVLLKRNHREVDWDGDGDLDIISADRSPQVWLFENIGTREAPRFCPEKVLKTHEGEEIWIPGQLNCVVPYDWDGDGDLDLLWGGEDGFIGLVENIAGLGKDPKLVQSVMVEQINPWVDTGSLAIPQIVDWDGDGDLDVVTGGSDAYILFFENIGSGSLPVFADPFELKAGGEVISLIAGPDGSVQGPQEAHWGYNNPKVVDWDGDGDLDLVVSGIRGDHTFFENVGTRADPILAPGEKIQVEWESTPARPPWLPYEAKGDELITVWRSRPEILDWNDDGLMDYICLDHMGELAFYERFLDEGELKLKPGKNIFTWDQGTSRLRIWSRRVGATAGRSGRTVISLIDWDGDGDHDLIADCMNARLYENVAGDDSPNFKDRGDMVSERLVNHNAGPCVVDWDGDGSLDLFVGGESGQIYYFHRAYIEGDCSKISLISIEERTSEVGFESEGQDTSGYILLPIIVAMALLVSAIVGFFLLKRKRG